MLVSWTVSHNEMIRSPAGEHGLGEVVERGDGERL